MAVVRVDRWCVKRVMNERGPYVIPSVEMDTDRAPSSVKVCVHPDQKIRVSHVFKVFIHTFQVIGVVILLGRVFISVSRVEKGFVTEDPHVTGNVYPVLNSGQALPDRRSVINPEIGIPGLVKPSHSILVHAVWRRMAPCATRRVAPASEVTVPCVKLPIQENTRRFTISRNKNNWLY